MAGNPDQQEDTLDDQYQEEEGDEVCSTVTLRSTFNISETNTYSVSHTDQKKQENMHFKILLLLKYFFKIPLFVC